jgi:hypothetical protein
MELTAPVSAVWCTEEEVLQDDGDEVPSDNLSPEKGLVEGWHFAWLLAVVVGKSHSQQNTHKTQEDADGITDRAGIKSVKQVRR